MCFLALGSELQRWNEESQQVTWQSQTGSSFSLETELFTRLLPSQHRCVRSRAAAASLADEAAFWAHHTVFGTFKIGWMEPGAPPVSLLVGSHQNLNFSCDETFNVFTHWVYWKQSHRQHHRLRLRTWTVCFIFSIFYPWNKPTGRLVSLHIQQSCEHNIYANKSNKNVHKSYKKQTEHINKQKSEWAQSVNFRIIHDLGFRIGLQV